MRDVLFTVLAFVATITLGLAVGAGYIFVETGRGLHPVTAGIVGLVALVTTLYASGEIQG